MSSHPSNNIPCHSVLHVKPISHQSTLPEKDPVKLRDPGGGSVGEPISESTRHTCYCSWTRKTVLNISFFVVLMRTGKCKPFLNCNGQSGVEYVCIYFDGHFGQTDTTFHPIRSVKMVCYLSKGILAWVY